MRYGLDASTAIRKSASPFASRVVARSMKVPEGRLFFARRAYIQSMIRSEADIEQISKQPYTVRAYLQRLDGQAKSVQAQSASPICGARFRVMTVRGKRWPAG